jgi:hypothetical protein
MHVALFPDAHEQNTRYFFDSIRRYPVLNALSFFLFESALEPCALFLVVAYAMASLRCSFLSGWWWWEGDEISVVWGFGYYLEGREISVVGRGVGFRLVVAGGGC